MDAPEFIDPIDISRMDDTAIDKHLDRVRESRLRAYYLYMEAEKIKQEVRDEKLRIKLHKQCEMFGKEIARADRVILALEKRINNIRSIQLELGELPE